MLAAATDVDRAGRRDGSRWKHLGARNILDAIAYDDPIVHARYHVHPVDRPNFCCRDVAMNSLHVVDAIDITVARNVADPLNRIVPIHGLHAIAAGSMVDNLCPAIGDCLGREPPGASDILALVDDPRLMTDTRNHVDPCDGLHARNVHDPAGMSNVSVVVYIPIASAPRYRSHRFGRVACRYTRPRTITALSLSRHRSGD